MIATVAYVRSLVCSWGKHQVQISEHPGDLSFQVIAGPDKGYGFDGVGYLPLEPENFDALSKYLFTFLNSIELDRRVAGVESGPTSVAGAGPKFAYQWRAGLVIEHHDVDFLVQMIGDDSARLDITSGRYRGVCGGVIALDGELASHLPALQTLVADTVARLADIDGNRRESYRTSGIYRSDQIPIIASHSS